MKDHYDFSNAVQNPYAKKLKKTVRIKLNEDGTPVCQHGKGKKTRAA